MSEIKNTTIGDSATSESLRELLRNQPNDLSTKEKLVQALLNEFKDVDETAPNESLHHSLKIELEEILATMPEGSAQSTRAFLSYLNDDQEQSLFWLEQLVKHLARDALPLSCDDLLNQFIYPFEDVEDNFWELLSERVHKHIPDSAADYWLKSFVQSDNPDTCASLLLQCLQQDSGFWRASWDLADIYSQEKNWIAADSFFAQTLKSAVAQEHEELHNDYAWCLGKLKRYVEEEHHLRICLELDPDFNCRNNLGWSLYKQNKFEEALLIFEEAIKSGDSGKYPMRNKARSLARLQRFGEAIAAWASIPGQRTKFENDEMNRVRKMMERQHTECKSEASPKPVGDFAEIEDAAEDQVDEEATQELQPLKKNESVENRTAALSELLLEESIERLIRSQKPIFDRQLRMFQNQNFYGRQFIIPGHGRIDLLTEDCNTGDLVVIELKKDQSHESVVGQIALYMQWLRENLALPQQHVIGIVCVFSASTKLKLAAKTIPGLEVFEYSLNFIRV